ncbi:FG-GAP repeat domain-containing protein [Nonomuraea sp. H19]|uniref:FG-GAP repeat domain-containing protein n=1 Tax=Nonomuraea sp. H19 TaxID=3452206 RepID=UPI003F8931E1
MSRKKTLRSLKALVATIAILSTTLFVLAINSLPANADWAHDKCSNITLREKVVADSPYIKLAGEEKYRVGNNDEEMAETLSFTKGVTGTATWHYKGSAELSFGKILEVGGEAGYQDQEALNDSFTRTVPVKTAKGQFKLAQQYVLYHTRNYYRQWVTPSGYLCGNTLTGTAAFPDSSGVCVWEEGKVPESVCRHWQFTYGGGGGPAPGGTTPPQPPAPQPVTSVHGLADGTVLATTDTKRIYKMVGGAPVWQATCADNICQPQSRPTTQAVINAGPATPRNGSTAVDQRGRIYLFVGGAPLWQDTCAAPVTCGSPVKVSDWSIDAREHMNQRPADGHLVQAKSGSVDLPVAVTVGGALIPFANPQEVIDSGYGGDWASRVVAISAHSYQLLGFDPANNTLIQGAAGGVSTPVAMVVGNAIIPFASEQEVIDVGYGANWRSLVRGVPARVFNARSRIPADMTLVQGAGGGVSSPVAQVVGGARINFANPQEAIDAGYGTDWASKVRAIPIRAFNQMRADIPDDGTLVQGPGTAVARMVGGARVEFANPQEVIDCGYGNDWGRMVRAIPARVFHQIPTKIADGTRLKDAGSTTQAAVVGGAKIDFASEQEVADTGYANRPMQVIPNRAWRALPTQIADGTRLKDSASALQAAVIGGAIVPFDNMEEVAAVGYADRPMQVIPNRVWKELPTRIADGTHLQDVASAMQAGIMGGARVIFGSPQELAVAGYDSKPIHKIPRRVWDRLPVTPVGGTQLHVVGDGIQSLYSFEASDGARLGTCDEIGCDSAQPVSQASVVSLLEPIKPTAADWADVDGDGRRDYCRRVGVQNYVSSRVQCTLSTGSGFGATITSGLIDWGYAAGRAWADVNGDGKADYCRVLGTRNHTSAYVACAPSTGSGFGADIMSSPIDWGYTANRAWADANGDGKADYCRRVGGTGDERVACTVSTGTGFGATFMSAALQWGHATGRAWADVNGDGKADYCRVHGTTNNSDARVSCAPSTGSGFGADISSTAIDWGFPADRTWTDANGDGKADYCRRVGGTSDQRVACTFSTGSAFGATALSSALDWGQPSGRAWADVNGDGKADYCRVRGTTNNSDARVSCAPSTGNGFGADITSNPIDWGYPALRIWTDIGGDGKADFCRRIGSTGDNRLACTPSTGTAFGATAVSGTLDWGLPD